MDTLKDREPEPSSRNNQEMENLHSKIFEQERQIERLMTALASSPSSHPSHDPLVNSAVKNEPSRKGELERVLQELEELKLASQDKERKWEGERKEAAARYEGMMKQLTGELDNLREEKLHTSRRWDDGKQELEKTQQTLDELKAKWEKEQADLDQKIKLQTEKLEESKKELEERTREWESQLEKRSVEWNGEKSKLVEDIDESKKRYHKLMDEQVQAEEAARKELDLVTNKLESLKKVKLNLEGQLTDLKEAKAELDSLVQAKERELEEKTKRIEESDKAEAESRRKTTGLESQISALQKACEDSENKSKDQTTKYENERDTLKEEIRFLKIRVEQMEKERSELVAKTEDLKSEIRDRTAEFDSMHARFEELAVDSEGQQLRVVEEKRALEARLTKLGEEAETQLADTRRSLTDQLKVLQEQVSDKDNLLKIKEDALREKDELLRGQNSALLEKNDLLRTQDTLLKEKDAQIRDKDAAVAQSEEMSKSVANLSQLLETKDKGHSEEMLDYERRMMIMEERQKQEESDRYRMFELEREGILIDGYSLMFFDCNKSLWPRIMLPWSNFKNSLHSIIITFVNLYLLPQYFYDYMYT